MPPDSAPLPRGASRGQPVPRLALCALLVACPGAAGAAQDPPQDSALTRAMARGLRDEGLVGAVWATVAGDAAPSLGAAGRRRADHPEPLRVDDRVQVGSVTKTLVATGVLRLVTEGRLALDTPLAAVLPRVRVANPWSATRPLRLRHLLDHTSGLDDARLWQLFSAAPRPETPLAEGFDPRRLRLALRHPPGDRFSYSNTGYGLLGLVIEAVTGERYESYLDARLLRPLGMTSSTFQFVGQVGPGADPRLAMGHFEAGALAPAVPTYLRPAMQFTTTAADMARLARFLMGDGTIAGAPFVDARLLRAMGTPAGTAAANAGLAAGYALGLATRDRHGAVGRCHAGNTVGYRAMLCLYPEERKAFFVAMNADDEDADYARLDSLVVASLGLAGRPAAPSRSAGVRVDGWVGTYVPRPPRFEMLAYADAVVGFVRAHREGDRLVLRPFLGNRVELAPAGASLFRAPGRTRPSHVLLTTADGARAISTGLQTYERVGAWRIVPLWGSLAAGILGTGYVLVRGLARLARRTLRRDDPLLAPLLVVSAMMGAGVLLQRQSMLALGDRTPASGLLALATALLPLAAAFGVWRAARSPRRDRAAVADAAALLAILQWAAVLAAWGLVPLRLWS